MDTFTDGVWTVAQIVFVNAVLSGDNALVIAMTAKRFPAGMRKKAILWGSSLAVLLQVGFAILVGRLLEVPGLRIAGAFALILIARKLIGEAREQVRETGSSPGVTGAVLTILIANLAMSLDNVLAVGALSRGVPGLIALGIGVSAVMLLVASAVLIAMIERYRWVTLAGAGLLACTAAGMICDEPLLAGAADLASKAAAPESAERERLTELSPAAASLPHELMSATADSATGRLTRSWTFAVYGMALSLCFGNLRWWGAIRRFERDRDARGIEGDPLFGRV